MRPSLRREPSGLSNLTTLLVAVVLIAGAVVWYASTIASPPSPPRGPHAVEPGDQVRVDYIGYFQDGSGVFDTSLLAVAQDNATWAKSITFNWRPGWSPLTVAQVGNRTVIPGFDDGLLGMVVGETKRIVVPPERGYGVAEPALFVRRPVLQEVPVRQQMNVSEFRSRYTTSPVDGGTVSDPFWNWTALVSVSGDFVTVTNSPSIGQSVRPYRAWNARVESVDDTANGGVGAIRVRHFLTQSDVGRVLVSDGNRRFAIASVDLSAGEYVADYNFRGQGTNWIWLGKVMVFEVTVLNIST